MKSERESRVDGGATVAKASAKQRANARRPSGAKTVSRCHRPTQARTAGRAEPQQLAERALAIADVLERLYPDAHCELDYGTPFQLLVATILSAQCTDKLVNTVTPELFARFPDARAMATADPAEIEGLVAKTGFFRQKTRNILAAAQTIVREHGGDVPQTMEALVRLSGVARKTANVVLGSAYGMNEGMAVDTHVTRLSQRLGLTRQEDPQKIEPELLALFPRDRWTMIGHQIIWHGRRVCQAKKPACERCELSPLCPSVGTV